MCERDTLESQVGPVPEQQGYFSNLPSFKRARGNDETRVTIREGRRRERKNKETHECVRGAQCFVDDWRDTNNGL